MSIPNLSDFIPEELKNDFADQNLTVGTVIRKFAEDTTPPKKKRFIIIGIDRDRVKIGTVYINSDINFNIFRSEDLKRLHIKIRSAKNEFIEHDSYVNCSEIFEKDYKEVFEYITKYPKEVLGKADEIDMINILTTIKTAKTIEPKKKKRYGLK